MHATKIILYSSINSKTIMEFCTYQFLAPLFPPWGSKWGRAGIQMPHQLSRPDDQMPSLTLDPGWGNRSVRVNQIGGPISHHRIPPP